MRQPLYVILLIMCHIFGFYDCSNAAEIILSNKDRITGNIIEDGEQAVTIETDTIGIITINKSFIEKIIIADDGLKAIEEQEKDPVWQREVSLGFDKSTGNTEKILFLLNLYGNRKTDGSDLTLKGNSTYSSSEGKMDAQKWYAMGRYGFKIWRKKWLHFYKVEADHDRFAQVDYRLVPSAGIGYSLFDTEKWEAMLEGAIGFEHTNYRSDNPADNETIFIGRAYVERKFSNKAGLSQDISVYQSFDNTDDWRVRSETSFTNPISNILSLRIGFTVNYDSEPLEGIEHTDTQLSTLLICSF